MPREDQLSSYDYHLPDELIAREPLAIRDASRLMVVDRRARTISHRMIRDLPELLKRGDCLVLNNTRVLPARLFGVRTQTGGKWEGLYLNSTPDGLWRMIGQTRGYLRPNESITVTNDHGETLLLKLVAKEPDGICQYEASIEDPLETLPRFGTVPLPPYMDRKIATATDWERYQTTFACNPGSVAAPTAGLHFTPQLLDHCRNREIDRTEVTLHVGIGTFRPVSVENLSEHRMHSEWCELSIAAASQLREVRQRNGRIVAVGTTSLRTLESAYHFSDSATPAGFKEWRGETSLFVRPPYDFQAADVLLTNFHLPKSTLLMLIAAFAGSLDFILQAYQVAIAERYRFFSYGDAMLIV